MVCCSAFWGRGGRRWSGGLKGALSVVRVRIRLYQLAHLFHPSFRQRAAAIAP